jgi:H+/Cl- antiporter ClcA
VLTDLAQAVAGVRRAGMFFEDGKMSPHTDNGRDARRFTATPRLLWITTLAIGIGVIAAFVAKALLALIAIFTNLFFFQRFSMTPVSPAGHTLGWIAIGVPVAGALIIGLMARYGSERIRGHGIPEAIERS